MAYFTLFVLHWSQCASVKLYNCFTPGTLIKMRGLAHKTIPLCKTVMSGHIRGYRKGLPSVPENRIASSRVRAHHPVGTCLSWKLPIVLSLFCNSTPFPHSYFSCFLFASVCRCRKRPVGSHGDKVPCCTAHVDRPSDHLPPSPCLCEGLNK